MKRLKTKEFWVGLFMCLLGVLGIAIMAKHVADWKGWGRAWETDPNIKYMSNEVASRWTSLLYFTNITLFLFCIYTILNFVAVAFNIEKLKRFLLSPYVLMFFAINQLLVLLVFTLMVAVFGIDLSPELMADPMNRHEVGASLFKHYVLTIAAIVFVFSQRPRQKVSFKKCLWFLAYPAAYAVLTKILGATCFVYEWYPYPFFGAKHLWFNLFHTFENYNAAYAILMVIGCLVVIAGLYVLITYLCCLVYNKLAAREAAKNQPAA